MTRPSSPLLGRSYLTVLVATVAAFGGYALLLPVLPLWVSASGAGPAVAGSVTGIFMGATVLSQLGVPALLRAVGHRTALLLAAVALGLPAALLPLTPSPALAVGVSLVRGVGFGILTVTGAALVSDLVPEGIRGRATGVYGLAIGAPQLVLLTGGVWAFDRLGPTPVLLLGAVLPLLAVPAILALPRRVVPIRPPGASRSSPSFLRSAAAPWSVMLVCAAAAGGVITVLPLAIPAGSAAVALFALIAAQLLGRAASGEIVDRAGGAGRVTAPALGLVAAGAGLLAWGLAGGGPAAVTGGAALVGLGFGAVQNDTLVTLFERAGPDRSGPASSVWNTAYDAGTGLGATALAAVLGGFGAPTSFVVAALACAVVGPFAAAAARSRTSAP